MLRAGASTTCRTGSSTARTCASSTRATARELAAGAGFSVAQERFATGPLPLERFARARLGGTEQQPAPAVARVREALTRRAPELFALQFVLALEPLR